MLIAFFLAPLYYVFLFSTGQRYQGVTKAAALINGELTSFSWDRWRELLGTDVTVRLLNVSATHAVVAVRPVRGRAARRACCAAAACRATATPSSPAA